MSIIIPLFVGTVERSESGSGGMSFAEGGLPPAYMFIFLLGVRQVGVHSHVRGRVSPLASHIKHMSSRPRCNPPKIMIIFNMAKHISIKNFPHVNERL